jgi:hypothetical protein
MANLDTADKRASSINFGLPFGRLLPTPDGSWDQGDRQQVGLSYRGVLAGAITHALVGQWCNVMLLESNQPTISLYGQDTITLGSDQSTYRVELD